MSYRTPAALEMAVKAAATASPIDANRAMAGFYFHRFLCRVFRDPRSRFALKGGQGALARTIDAQATRDIDLMTQETDVHDAVEELKKLASADLTDFVTFSFDRAEPIKAGDEYRRGVKVRFVPMLGGKRLQPISIDLVIDEIAGPDPDIVTPADRLLIEGLPTFDYRVCRVECALADKLLAMIETHDGKPSSRVKDLVDVIVYARACEIDCKTLADAVSREASARKVALPESFSVPHDWTTRYGQAFSQMAAQAKILGIAPNLNAAEQVARTLYAPALHDPRAHMRWDPTSLCWMPGDSG